MTPLDIVLNHVCPGVGVVIAVITFASPLPAILAADKTKDLKGLNPLPFVAMAANCSLGSIYGQITGDSYIYVGNLIGLMLSWYFIFTTYKLASSKEQRKVTVTALAAVFVLVTVGAVNLFQVVGTQILWGSTAVAVLGIYYSAPLSSLFKVLRERDSSSIYAPLCLTNLTCAVLWFVYGMARRDYYFIALPNGMGVAFNSVSLLLCLLLPARERQQQRQKSVQLDSVDGGSSSSSSSSSREPSMLRRLLLRSFVGSSSDAYSSSSSRQPVCVVDIEPAAAAPAAGNKVVAEGDKSERAGDEHPHAG